MNDPGPSAAYYRRFPDTAEGPIRPPSPPVSPLLRPTQTAQQFMDTQAAGSLYAILNVETDASLSEIKERYRSLASTYHPDKQPDEQRRLAAHTRFTAIKRAYEILSDPTKRHVYDTFGEEGLRTSWDVGPSNMTTAQMQAHYTKQANAKRLLDAEQLLQAKSDDQVVVDARAVFVRPEAFQHPERVDHSVLARIRRVRPGQVLMRHSFETPINERTQVVWEGTMVARNNQGGANVSGTIKHQFSPKLWLSFTQTALAPRIATGKATYTIDENTFVTGTAIVQTLQAPPRMTLTLGRRIYEETTGFLTYKTGFFSFGPWGRNMPDNMRYADQSALSIGVTTARRTGTGWTMEAQTGIVENMLSGDWSTHALGLKIKFGASLDFGGGAIFADASGKVTQYTKAGAMLQLQMSGALQIKLHASRLGQRVSLPILLSQDLNRPLFLAAVVLPTTAWAALYHFVVKPSYTKAISARLAELRAEHADYIAQKQQEANDAILLLTAPAARITARERERNGLVILSAHYGLGSAFTPKGFKEIVDEKGNNMDVVIDVTIPVQALVSESRLNIPGGRAKHNVIGFWDPCIGENKRLRVRYLFQGKVHEVTVDDVSNLRAPVRSHALEE